MDEPTRLILSTIYGEAAQSSPGAWRAIASVILNRVGYKEWRKYSTPLAIVVNTGFDAFAQENAPFCAARLYLGRPDPGDRLRALMAAVLPILDRAQPPTTDAVLYFSPKAQEALHRARPKDYPAAPSWHMGELDLVVPQGLQPEDDFRFYRYKRPAA